MRPHQYSLAMQSYLGLQLGCCGAVSTELVHIPFEGMAPSPREASIPFHYPLCSVRVRTYVRVWCASTYLQYIHKVHMCIIYIRTYKPTGMRGISVCLFANSFSSLAIDSPPQSVLRWLAFCFRSYFKNSNGTVLSAVLERRHFNDTFTDEYGS